MKKTKVLLHLGLPKTATSSLQHNVLQRLHAEGKINFLGKCLNYDLKTKKLDIKNYTGKFIRDGAEGNITISEAQSKLVDVLDKDSLNVFSDEGLMVAYPGKENRPLSVKFDNLSEIFREYDLKVVVTLRNPVDYLYSLYVELYPDYCSSVRDLNTIKKYTNKFLKNPDCLLFESLFFDRWLEALGGKFSVSVLSYEKLANHDQDTSVTWANLLGIDVTEFSECFNTKKVNVKAKSGKEVRQVKDLKRIEEKLKVMAAKVKPVYASARWIYNASGLKKVINYRFVSKKTHEYPSGSNLEQLNAMLRPSAERNESL